MSDWKLSTADKIPKRTGAGSGLHSECDIPAYSCGMMLSTSPLLAHLIFLNVIRLLLENQLATFPEGIFNNLPNLDNL